jgi:uncharacterized protein with beta-barrel porin domain
MAVTTSIAPAGLLLGGLASGNNGGAEYNTFISAGYDYHVGHLSLGPITALQYTYVNIDDFNEHGSLAPLNIHSQSAGNNHICKLRRATWAWKLRFECRDRRSQD